jgi:predicted transcriptional regulator
MDHEEKEKELDDVFSAVGSLNRIKTLQMIKEQRSPKEISKKINISGGGLQRYLRTFMETEIIERTTDGYKITSFGEEVLDKAIGYQKDIDNILENYKQSIIKPTTLKIVKEAISRRSFKAQTLKKLKEIVEEIEKEE